MIKFQVMALVLAICVACSNAPPPTRARAEPFTVLSEQPGADNLSLTVIIKLNESPTEPSARTIAESVIASRKDRYQNITVESYLSGASASDPPYSVSKLEGGSVTHRFNSQVAPQRIPTH
ncbi:MAG: hypothetical protein L0229_16575 [Blastocatellia bacterium]|nr:hypothetical protein [Blastocatellia bacterium]